MGMLARPIPKEIRDAMEAPDAINLGWARNFPALRELAYPGWGLIKEHLAFDEAFVFLEPRLRDPVKAAKSYEEMEAIEDNNAPIIPGLLAALAKKLNKKLYVTKVQFSDGAGVYEGIDVLCVSPDGTHTWTAC